MASRTPRGMDRKLGPQAGTASWGRNLAAAGSHDALPLMAPLTGAPADRIVRGSGPRSNNR
jgi:hypothetical protein